MATKKTLTQHAQQKGVNFNSLLMTTLGTIISLGVAGVWRSVSGVAEKVEKHSNVIEYTIPAIEKKVDLVSVANTETGKKIDGLITRNELNVKQEATNTALKELRDGQKSEEIELAKTQGRLDAMRSQPAPPK